MASIEDANEAREDEVAHLGRCVQALETKLNSKCDP